MRGRFLATASFLLMASFALAQMARERLERSRTRYGDAPSVLLKNNTTIILSYEKDKVKAIRRVERERMLLTKYPGMGSDEVHYAKELVTLEGINAWSMVPGEKGYRKVPVEHITHKDELDDQVFHNDERSASFVYPVADAGTVTHLDYGLVYTDPRMLTGHYFGDDGPVEESRLTVICDPGIDFDVRTFNVDSSALHVERTTKGKRTITTYSMNDLKAFPSDDDAPPYRYYIPHAVVMVKGFHHGDRSEELLGTTALLYRMYYANIAGTEGPPSAEVAALVDSITDPGLPEVANVRRIYNWVQDHVKYIAFEDGMNGMVPMPAGEVLANRYGDCKGMACLVTTMARCIHADVHLAWTGSRNLPYTYEQLPAPVADDHMIAVYRPDSAPVFLDATGDETPFGMPTAFIQGKEVMVSEGPDRFTVLHVPVVPAARNIRADTNRVRIDGSRLVGTTDSWSTGFHRSGAAAAIKATKPEDRKELVRRMLDKGNNKFIVDSIRITGMEDKNAPLHIRAWWSIGDIVRAGKGERYVNLHLDRPFLSRNYRSNRKLGAENRHTSDFSCVTVLKVPPGAKVTYVPGPSNFTDDRFSYAITYGSTPEEVSCTGRFIENRIHLSLDDLKTWRTLIDQLRTDMDRAIVIQDP
jgi:hypothetical protein